MLKRIIAKIKFIIAPATNIAALAYTDLLLKLLLSSDASSSPSIFTYPPIGKSRSVYFVSPRVKSTILGPIPIANSCTFTPTSFATPKCPSS